MICVQLHGQAGNLNFSVTAPSRDPVQRSVQVQVTHTAQAFDI